MPENDQIAAAQQRCAERLSELEKYAHMVTKGIDLLISEKIIDQLCGTMPLVSGRQAAYALDSSHLTSSLHAFYSARIQNLTLNPVKAPPENLNDVGAFHLLHVHGMTLPPKAQATKKLSSKEIIRNLFFSFTGELSRFNWSKSIETLFVTNLFNVAPKLNFRNAIRLMICGLRYKIVFIDSTVEKRDFETTGMKCNPQLREAFKVKIVSMLKDAIPDGEAAAQYVAETTPISHLEKRFDNLQFAMEFVKNWRCTGIVSSNGLASSTSISFISAAIKQKSGGRLIGIQHGGYYGYTKCHNHAFNTELSTLDDFITWGWIRTETVFGKVAAKTKPIGSFHLRSLCLTNGMDSSTDKTPLSSKRPRIMFICGPWDRIFPRADQQLGLQIIEESIFPINAKAIAQFCERVGGDLYFKGAYDKEMELKYINQINKNFGSSASKCTILDNSLRAFDLYSSFDIMLFDSLGTGFFECISAGNAAFLLPSADWTPHRDAVEPVSENFFVSRTSINSLDQAKAVFAKASYESKSFMSTYGKPTDVDIVDFLITLQE